MPHRSTPFRFPRKSWDEFSVEIRQAQNEHLMEGIVAGCALVAFADGWVTDEEHDRMVRLIRGFGPIKVFGLADVIETFEARTRQFAADQRAGEEAAVAAVARVRGSPYVELLVETCCAIAAADGGFDGEERAAVIRICKVLKLDPDKFEIAEAA